MSVIKDLANEAKIPKFYQVEQIFKTDHIEVKDIKKKVYKELEKIDVNSLVKPGMTVAITCGSRGIANIKEITKAIGEYFIEIGAKPFVTATMGSHGGATAAGQRKILADYGVTEEYLGFPVKSSMETSFVGKTPEGHSVLIDKNAYEADAIFVAGRIKAHTAFEGPHESGIMKMITIGLGKQQGAEVVHESGFGTAHHTIPMFAKVTLQNTNIVGALGIIENAYDQTYDLVSMKNEEIDTVEPELLALADSLMGKIYIPEVDVLIVDKIGKNMSGDGMDPNVTGRFGTPYRKSHFKKQRIAVLDLTDETHGNFNGLGLADVTTKRVYDKVDLDETYPNAITSTVLQMVKIPMVLPDDETAIKIAIRSCNNIDKDNPRIIRIKDTMSLKNIEVSEALINEVENNSKMKVISEAYCLKFDEEGNLF